MSRFYFLVIGSVLLGCGSQIDKQYNCIIEGDQCQSVDKTSETEPAVVVQGPVGQSGQDGSSCTVVELDLGRLISCEDGTSSFIYNPENGLDGENGVGQVGAQGEKGDSGQDGESCQVTQAINGALITCGLTSALVLNGQDGQDAPPTAYTVTEVIDPCGNHLTRIDEVLLKLANGSIIASFSDNVSGLNTRFAIIGAGTYGTTDGTGCVFNVSNSGVVTW
jgi:hypothetical protein